MSWAETQQIHKIHHGDDSTSVRGEHVVWVSGLTHLWDAVALWVALEMVDQLGEGRRGPPVSYWPGCPDLPSIV